MNLKVVIRSTQNIPGSPVRAYADITLNEVFVVRDVKLIQLGNRLFMGMPSKDIGNEKWRDMCHPINADFREEMQAAYIEAYNDYLTNQATKLIVQS